jgi:hypothetical protein
MGMTNLSPEAQQVFWEFNRAASGKPDDWHYLPAIAATLRTAALYCKRDRLQLLAIADELEAFSK